MLRLSLAILSLISGAACVEPGLEMSKWDDGYHSIQFYLKRDPSKKPSHFYYPVTIGGQDYPMQISTFSSISGIVGDNCPDDVCIVPKKLKTPVEADRSLEKHFKDFYPTKVEETGF